MRRLIFLAVLYLFSHSIFASVHREVVRFDDFRSKSESGSRWTGQWYKKPGYPEIPVVWKRLLLPYGEGLTKVVWKVKGHRRYLDKVSYPIVPFPSASCKNDFKSPEPTEFESGSVYPESNLGTPHEIDKNGYRIVYIPLFPVQYFPADGKSVEIDKMVLTTRTRKNMVSALFRGDPDDKESVGALIENPELLSTYPLFKNPARSAEYLIIGPKEFTESEAIRPLVAAKEESGLNVKLLSLEEISEDFGGDSVPDQIRNAIKHYYQNGGTRFVVLLGDGYSITPTQDIPMSLYNAQIASDYYFACLDDDNDMACEVAVGRLPAEDLSDLDHLVHKSLALSAVQSSDPRVWNVLNFGEQMDASTLGSYAIEKLVDGAAVGNYSTQGYPETAQVTRLYETASWHANAGDTADAINSGEFYTVNHLGHASAEYCLRTQKSELESLNNSLPFFLVTQGCHAGDLHKPNWASYIFKLAHGGAGAVVANSNYGWYQPSGALGPSNYYHLTLYDTIFAERNLVLGKAHFRAKERLIPEAIANQYVQWVIYETNLLADPAMELKFPG